MKNIIKSTLILLIMIIFIPNLKADTCPFALKVNAEFWNCGEEGTSQKILTCKTIEWDEEENGVIIHKTKLIAIFYCCGWDETTKTLNVSIEELWSLWPTSVKPPLSVLIDGVIQEILKNSKINCRSEYPACDDPNVSKVYEQKISFPTCWYYKNYQPLVGDEYILSMVKCEGSRCISTYEVCTDYSSFPYQITNNLVSKIIEGIPCTTAEPILPPESSPVWQQNWTTPCFILNSCN